MSEVSGGAGDRDGVGRDGGTPIRILHVDDEPALGETAKLWLERENDRFEVVTETDAAAALERLDAASIDCVISDYDMPETDGLEFLSAVREAHPALPFVLFTGKGSEEIASEAISAGVTEYLQKEVGTDQYTVLANRVERAVAERRTATALQTERDRLSALFENAATSVVYYEYATPENNWPTILEVNDAFEETFGYEAAAVVGETIDDVLFPADDHELAERNSRRVRDGERLEYEARRQTNDGLRDFRVRTVPLRPGESGREGWIIYSDITELKRRERELRATEQRYRRVVEQDLFGVYVLQDGAVAYANPKAASLFGCDRDDLVGREVEDLIAPADRERLRENVEALLSGERDEVTASYTGIDADGARVPIRVRSGVIEYEGEPALLGTVVAATD
ncbi:MAG: PAS domain S-box protein [Haloarculaceae archaeon]